MCIRDRAKRLRRRHLGTLDPNLSHATVVDAAASDLQVVMPAPVRDLYDSSTQRHLWTVADFIAHVAGTQRT